MAAWTLDDNTNGKNGGYLQINRDGKRVADCFPYARGADPDWIRAEAQQIVDMLNAAEVAVRLETERCAEIARSLACDNVAEAIEMGAIVTDVTPQRHPLRVR